MRNITSPMLPFPSTAHAGNVPSSNDMTMSALQMTRDAIARWSGNTRPAAPRDLPHVSPQARWLAKTQQDLAAWIDGGGFAQFGNGAAGSELHPPLPAPALYDIADASMDISAHGVDACVD